MVEGTEFLSFFSPTILNKTESLLVVRQQRNERNLPSVAPVARDMLTIPLIPWCHRLHRATVFKHEEHTYGSPVIIDGRNGIDVQRSNSNPVWEKVSTLSSCLIFARIKNI